MADIHYCGISSKRGLVPLCGELNLQCVEKDLRKDAIDCESCLVILSSRSLDNQVWERIAARFLP